MTQEEEKLSLKDLCGRVLCGVKGKCEIDASYDTSFDTIFQTHKFDAILDGIKDGLLFVTPLIEDKDEQEFADEEVTDGIDILDFTPYLRLMSNMTEEEILELYKIAYNTYYNDSLYYKNEEFISFRDSIQNNSLCFKNSIWIFDINKVIDWLNSHHFDYLGLIGKGLALEAPKDMYN